MSEPDTGLSLTTRVLVTVLSILVVGGVLVTGSTWWNGTQAARQSYDRILVGAASDIAESIRIQDAMPLVDLPVSAFELLAQAPDDRIYYAVTGPGGRVITLLDEDLLISPPSRGGGPVQLFDASLDGEPARFVQVTRRFVERDFSGPVQVIVGQTLRARTAMTRDLMLDALLPMAAAGIVVLIFSILVVRSALKPLGNIVDDLTRRDPHDLTAMPTHNLPREMQIMLGAMNRFMGRIDAQVDAMRNLISDTAHQLRTPVAAIQVHTDSAISAPDADTRDKAFARLQARTRSLRTLLDQLLSRALVIHRTDSAPRVTVDLREVALEVLEREDHIALAPDADVRLEIGEDPVLIWADAFSVTEAARNLLANALRHGQQPVTIGATMEGTEAVLWIEDSGPGPDASITAQLGQRFNRDASSGEQSSGIGLSIVASVAQAFGGRTAMESHATGFRASLIFPAKDR